MVLFVEATELDLHRVTAAWEVRDARVSAATKDADMKYLNACDLVLEGCG